MSPAARHSCVLLFAIVVAALGGCRSGVDTAAVRAEVGDAPVVLLSTAWCGYCSKLRNDLALWGVSHAEFDVEATAEGRSAYHLVGGRGVPILLVGDKVVHGYAPERARELIAAAGFGAVSD